MNKLEGSILVATISPDTAIVGGIDSPSVLEATLSVTSDIHGELATYMQQKDIDYYTGEYEVDPDFERQTLETNNKYLTEDVVVNPIEVETVSNPAGGNTIFIGGQTNG